ncbi:MAG: hypothetical protein EA377_03470 [Phycisphaerales bacterium]|nr:MAG: hypothetical protein EA377_03470 [Phycisphaerales bacterium]
MKQGSPVGLPLKNLISNVFRCNFVSINSVSNTDYTLDFAPDRRDSGDLLSRAFDLSIASRFKSLSHPSVPHSGGRTNLSGGVLKMKMKSMLAIAVVSAGSMTMAASADVIVAYWNFNSLDIPGTGSNNLPGVDGVPTDIAADFGSGNISLDNWGGSVNSFGGTTLNALFDDVAGNTLSLQGGPDVGGNGTWIDITFSMTDLQDLVMSFAGRGTGTGFNSNQVSYSTDGMSFTDLGSPYDSTQASFQLYEFDFGSALDDADNVTIRITFDGATSGPGNNRIDNLQLNAALIPAPGALALLGLAGIVGARRRRA